MWRGGEEGSERVVLGYALKVCWDGKGLWDWAVNLEKACEIGYVHVFILIFLSFICFYPY